MKTLTLHHEVDSIGISKISKILEILQILKIIENIEIRTLTLHHEVDSLGNRWRDFVAGNAEVRAHIFPPNL